MNCANLSCKKDNQVFNHDFVFPNSSGDFPAGWKIYTQAPGSAIYWDRYCTPFHNMVIHNRCGYHYSSICQKRRYYIAVCPQQTWEAGACFKVRRSTRASITVHFLNNCSEISTTRLDFCLMPGRFYYSRSVNIPADADYAWIEIGTCDREALRIENVFFVQIFPSPQCKVNVNTVEAVKKIIDPVKIERISCDRTEDVLAGPLMQYSNCQDILKLNLYTYCIINQGITTACVQSQMSPDGINFMDESMPDNLLPPGEMRVLDFNRFLRYIRVACWTEDSHTTPLRIFFQGQG